MFTQRLLPIVLASGLLLVLSTPAFSQSGDDSTSDTTPKEVSVGLKNGDIIRGSLAGENEKSIIIVSPILGTITLPRDEVDSVTELGDQDSAAEDPTKADSASSAVTNVKEVQDEAKKSPWSGSINIGLTYADANTLNLTLNVGGTIERKTDLSDFRVTGQYFYSRDDKVVTDNDIIVNADQTWFFTKEGPWSIFAKGTYQWDQFQAWEQRFSPYGGFGYAIFRQKDLKTQMRFGAGGTYEYGESDRNWDTQLLFEINTTWTIDARSSFTGALSYAPEVSDFNNYLLTLSAVYALKLFEDSPITLNASVLNIYDSVPGDNATGNDLKVVLGLGWAF